MKTKSIAQYSGDLLNPARQVQESDAESLRKILASRKYRNLSIPLATLEGIFLNEYSRLKDRRKTLKATKEKLHHVMALYLGDPDYAQVTADLQQAFESGNKQAVRSTLQEILNAHISTRERMPILKSFYTSIFSITGKPSTLFDLACGLNPLAFPWMELPQSVKYHAYDIHLPRIHLINDFFCLAGLQPLAEMRDIIVSPPSIEADMAWLLKEVYRLEERQPGCNRILWQALKVDWLVVSLPAKNMKGTRDLLETDRRLVRTILGNLPWQVNELVFDTEIVFCIKK